MKAICAALLAGAVLLSAAVPAFAHHNGGARNVWEGPRPDVCTGQYEPVHDRRGNTYSNDCFAAMHGVRVTWDGLGTDQS